LCLLNPEGATGATVQTKGFASTMTPVITPGPAARSAPGSIFATPPPVKRDEAGPADSAPATSPPAARSADSGRTLLLAAIAVAGLVIVAGVVFALFGR
jgi:hypothetical protein